MSDVLDLDALVPPSARIKFGEKEIEVHPPKTGDLLRLASLGKKMEGAADLKPEELEQLVADMTEVVVKIIPELSDASLNTQQLLKLVQLISEMGTPPEAKELAKAGITPADGSSNPKG